MKTYEQLQKSVKFYRVLSGVLLIAFLYVGSSNMNYAYRLKICEHDKQVAIKAQKKAEQDFKDGLCLPRLYEVK